MIILLGTLCGILALCLIAVLFAAYHLIEKCHDDIENERAMHEATHARYEKRITGITAGHDKRTARLLRRLAEEYDSAPNTVVLQRMARALGEQRYSVPARWLRSKADEIEAEEIEAAS